MTVGDDHGRREKFTSLYREHLPSVRAYVRISAPKHDLDEIVSETFASAWTMFDQISPGSEEVWLLARANGRIRRRRSRFRGVERGMPHSAREALTAASEELGSEEIRVVLDAFSRLPPPDRDVLALSLWLALRPGEIAIVIGAREDEVQARLRRAGNRLRHTIANGRTP